MKNVKVMKSILSFVVLSVITVLAIGSTDDSESVKSQESSMTVTSYQIYKDYKANEVKATGKYKDKVIVVKGKVQEVGITVMAEVPFITLKASNDGYGLMDGVKCLFAKSEMESVGNISVGQTVSIKGKVDGDLGNIELDNCSIQ